MKNSRLVEHRLYSADVDEISNFIRSRYADHRFTPKGMSKCMVDMLGREWNGVSIYDVTHETPFVLRSEEPRPNYLIVSCRRGGSVYSDGSRESLCDSGKVMPISVSGTSTCSTKEEGFDHLSVIIDSQKLNDYVGDWIGRPVVEPISFDLRPMARPAAAQWVAGAQCLQRMMLLDPVPHAAVLALTEHVLKTLVTGHANSYSQHLCQMRYVDERYAKSAVSLVRADPMHWNTLGKVALEMRCSTGVLENGIRRVYGVGFLEIFRDARLEAVNVALAGADSMDFAGTLRSYGFSLSKQFIHEYNQRFGESPAATYRRNPRARERVFLKHEVRDAMCERTVNQFIDARLNKSIGLSDLANLIGISEYETIAAFKWQFSKTPMQYVIERRLERARWLLENTSTSILSIAIECGFGTQSYMTTTMKKHFFATPRQIRMSRCRVDARLLAR
ncbi:AraC family transcriptional regulator [Burkholderia cepacia]|uniref:AraC family transcriptional regulator n=1 Tax=Burkholderia cepacia TaxID=292 RepID=UPI003528543D